MSNPNKSAEGSRRYFCLNMQVKASGASTFWPIMSVSDDTNEMNEIKRKEPNSRGSKQVEFVWLIVTFVFARARDRGLRDVSRRRIRNENLNGMIISRILSMRQIQLQDIISSLSTQMVACKKEDVRFLNQRFKSSPLPPSRDGDGEQIRRMDRQRDRWRLGNRRQTGPLGLYGSVPLWCGANMRQIRCPMRLVPVHISCWLRTSVRSSDVSTGEFPFLENRLDVNYFRFSVAHRHPSV